MIQRLQAPTQSKPPVTLREFAEMQYREGKLSHIPTKQPMPPEMLEALERRAQRYSGGKPASEMGSGLPSEDDVVKYKNYWKKYTHH